MSDVSAACPKSVRACALRLTRLNDSGVPLDPLTPNARIQTAGFAELTLDPDMESGQRKVTRSAGGRTIAVVDRDGSSLLGMRVRLRLCGVPLPVLEMLTNANLMVDGGRIVGAGTRNSYAPDCGELVAVELWSKNVNRDRGCEDGSDAWIHWVLGRTLEWEITGSLAYTNGPLEVELEGFAETPYSWFPSLPSSVFPSWVPGAGDASGWPIGSPGPVLPPDVTADAWTLADQQVVRSSGPLSWRVVDVLPAPLSDCGFLPVGDCVPFDADFCGPAGPMPEPWFVPVGVPDPFGVPAEPFLLDGSCSAVPPSEDLSAFGLGFVPIDVSCCGSCVSITTSGPVAPFGGDGFYTAPVLFGLEGPEWVSLIATGRPSTGEVTLLSEIVVDGLEVSEGSTWAFADLPDDPERWTVVGSFCSEAQTLTGVFFVDSVEVLRATFSPVDIGPLTQVGLGLMPVPGFSVDTFTVGCEALDPGVLVEYVSSRCRNPMFTDDFCGDAGPMVEPWGLLAAVPLAELSGSCSVVRPDEGVWGASMPFPERLACCDSGDCWRLDFAGDVEWVDGEARFPLIGVFNDDVGLVLQHVIRDDDSEEFTAMVQTVPGGSIVAVGSGSTAVVDVGLATGYEVEVEWCANMERVNFFVVLLTPEEPLGMGVYQASVTGADVWFTDPPTQVGFVHQSEAPPTSPLESWELRCNVSLEPGGTVELEPVGSA